VRLVAALTNELLPLQKLNTVAGQAVAFDSAVAFKSCESFNPMNPNSDNAPLSPLYYSATDRQYSLLIN